MSGGRDESSKNKYIHKYQTKMNTSTNIITNSYMIASAQDFYQQIYPSLSFSRQIYYTPTYFIVLVMED